MGSGVSKVEALNINVEDNSTKRNTKRHGIRKDKISESKSNNTITVDSYQLMDLHWNELTELVPMKGHKLWLESKNERNMNFMQADLVNLFVNGLTDSKDQSHQSQELQKKEDENNEDTEPKLNQDILLQEALDKIGMLEKQVIESESRELDLQDQIQSLEERIISLTTENDVKEQSETLTETLNVKDHCIAKLEKELEESKTLIKQLKIKHRKKVKVLTTKITEAKQDSSLQLIELKEEIHKLTDENGKLKDNCRESERDSAIMDEDEDFGSNKTKLILELSSQVSEQEETISNLEKKLHERDKQIEQLQNDTKVNALSDFKDDSSIKTAESDSQQVGELMTKNRKRSKFKKLNRTKGAGESVDSGVYPSINEYENNKVFQRLDRLPHANNKSFLSDSDEDRKTPLPPSKVHSAPVGTRSHKPNGMISRTPIGDIDLEDSWAWDDEKKIQSSWK